MYLSCQRIDISDTFYYNYTKIRVTSYEDLALEKTLNIQNSIIFLEPIFNSSYNNHHSDLHLVKCSYKLTEKVYSMLIPCILVYR